MRPTSNTNGERRYKLSTHEPLSSGAIDALTHDGSGYFPYTITGNTYPGQENGIDTVATAAPLLTDTAFSDAEISELVRRIFEKPVEQKPG